MLTELLVTEDRAAELLALRVPQLRRMANRGEVPCHQLPNGERRYDPDELREWARRLPKPVEEHPVQ